MSCGLELGGEWWGREEEEGLEAGAGVGEAGDSAHSAASEFCTKIFSSVSSRARNRSLSRITASTFTPLLLLLLLLWLSAAALELSSNAALGRGLRGSLCGAPTTAAPPAPAPAPKAAAPVTLDTTGLRACCGEGRNGYGVLCDSVWE